MKTNRRNFFRISGVAGASVLSGSLSSLACKPERTKSDLDDPIVKAVYDAALWSSIAPLGEWFVAHRSNSITVPDFTCGAYKTNIPVDISLAQGGNTTVRARVSSPGNQLNVQ